MAQHVFQKQQCEAMQANEFVREYRVWRQLNIASSKWLVSGVAEMESRNGDANTPSEDLSRQAWLLDLGSGTGDLPQLYAAGADNPFHAQALVGDYCNNAKAKINFEKELGVEDLDLLQLERGQVIPSANPFR